MQLLEDKKTLLQKCKELVENINHSEHEIASKVRSTTRDIELMLDKEKNTFRQNRDERLSKVI